jgi:hypothetical protein
MPDFQRKTEYKQINANKCKVKQVKVVENRNIDEKLILTASILKRPSRQSTV